MQKRIEYFDVIKTFSIFCVVYMHYPWISDSLGSNISMLACLCAVPLFLMVNGALLLQKKFDLNKHIKKTKKLLIDIYAWKFLILVLCIITKNITIKDLRVENVFFYLFSDYNLNSIPSEHIWFMWSLFKLYLIYPFITGFSNNWKKGLKIILIFCMIFSFGIDTLNMIISILNRLFHIKMFDLYNIVNSYSPFGFGHVLPLLSYFLLGHFIYEANKKNGFKKIKTWVLIIMFFIGLLLLFIPRYLQTGHVFYGEYQAIENDYHKIGPLIMSFSLFILFSRIKLKKYGLFNYIGSRTFNVFYAHMIITYFFSVYFRSAFFNIQGFKINFIRTIIVLILSIFVTEMMKKIPVLKKIVQ